MSMWTRQEGSWNRTRPLWRSLIIFGPVWMMMNGLRLKFNSRIWSLMTTLRKIISTLPHWLNFKSETLFWEWNFPLLQLWLSKSAKFKLHAMLKAQLLQYKQQMTKTKELQQLQPQIMNSSNSSHILIGDLEHFQPVTCKSELTMFGSVTMMSKKVLLTLCPRTCLKDLLPFLTWKYKYLPTCMLKMWREESRKSSRLLSCLKWDPRMELLCPVRCLNLNFWKGFKL